MFTDAQKAELAAKLDRGAVKERSQAGRTFSYIEGWHAIAECNRIFGFDGWSRETLEMRCVWEGARNDKQAAYYTAKVRVTVTAGETTIVREGTGSGSGFDRDLGAAHESAIKEAETDAMKRALMTFGNPFGLALYDKAQTDVEDKSAATQDNKFAEGAAEAWEDWAQSDKVKPWYKEAKAALEVMNTPQEIKQWQRSQSKEIGALMQYAPARHADVMGLINANLDAVNARAPKNLRAAG